MAAVVGDHKERCKGQAAQNVSDRIQPGLDDEAHPVRNGSMNISGYKNNTPARPLGMRPFPSFKAR